MSPSKHVTLAIDGMSCGHCVASVRKALDGVPGVSDATVAIGTARFAVDTDSAEQRTADAVHAIREAGYEASAGNPGVHAETHASTSCCSTPTVHQIGRS